MFTLARTLEVIIGLTTKNEMVAQMERYADEFRQNAGEENAFDAAVSSVVAQGLDGILADKAFDTHENLPAMPHETAVHRLGDVLYWLACILGAVSLALGAYISFVAEEVIFLLVAVVPAGAAWLVGRAFRYVLADR